jgi:hypothetical protein
VSALATALGALGFGLGVAAIVAFAARLFRLRAPFWGVSENALWAVAFGAWALQDILRASWLPLVFHGALTALNTWYWWRDRGRRNRKRALEALGAKSLARLAALVRKQREAARPRPVLRPAPGGVR